MHILSNGVGCVKKEEIEKYKQKMKKHEKLGALKFQKIVFYVEKIKFKSIKKICPNFIKHYDKYCDFFFFLSMKKAKTKEEIKQIERKTKFAKMEIRKEMNQEKNRNYHIDKNRTTEIYKYLEWNKKIHKNSITINMIAIPILITCAAFGIPYLTPLIAVEILSAVVNFECINIQNYNICRYKIIEDKLKKHEEKIKEKNIKDYYEISKVIYNTIEQNEKIPTMKEIIEKINTKEQAKELKEMLIKELSERGYKKEIIKAKGGII